MKHLDFKRKSFRSMKEPTLGTGFLVKDSQDRNLALYPREHKEEALYWKTIGDGKYKVYKVFFFIMDDRFDVNRSFAYISRELV